MYFVQPTLITEKNPLIRNKAVFPLQRRKTQAVAAIRVSTFHPIYRQQNTCPYTVQKKGISILRIPRSALAVQFTSKIK